MLQSPSYTYSAPVTAVPVTAQMKCETTGIIEDSFDQQVTENDDSPNTMNTLIKTVTSLLGIVGTMAISFFCYDHRQSLFLQINECVKHGLAILLFASGIIITLVIARYVIRERQRYAVSSRYFVFILGCHRKQAFVHAMTMWVRSRIRATAPEIRRQGIASSELMEQLYDAMLESMFLSKHKLFSDATETFRSPLSRRELRDWWPLVETMVLEEDSRLRRGETQCGDRISTVFYSREEGSIGASESISAYATVPVHALQRNTIRLE